MHNKNLTSATDAPSGAIMADNRGELKMETKIKKLFDVDRITHEERKFTMQASDAMGTLFFLSRDVEDKYRKHLLKTVRILGRQIKSLADKYGMDLDEFVEKVKSDNFKMLPNIFDAIFQEEDSNGADADE